MSRILIIDDSELVSRLLHEALTAEGFEVRTAPDAHQGYQSAIEVTPDLILLDVQLPDVVGLDLIHIIRNRDDLKHVPIIMITGTHGQTANKVKALKEGADDFILKPFDMPELIERIRAVLRRSQKSAASSYEKSGPMGSLSALSTPKIAARGAPIQTLRLGELISNILFRPETFSQANLPPITMHYLAALLGFSLGGWALSAGSTVNPALIVLGMPGFWGLCVAILVMSCSIMGISLTWKEGARLLSVAGLPLLLKLLGGCVMTLATSLTPFYFTASPDIFFQSSSAVLQRLDVFEIWMIWLIWTMVQSLKGSTKQKALVTALGVWPVVAYWQSLWKH